MDSADYLSKSTQNIRTSLETFSDEVQGELEKHSVFGVFLSRRIVCGALCTCAALAAIIGVTVGILSGGNDGDSSSSSDESGSSSLRADNRFWSFGQTIESSVGVEIFDNSTHEYKALQWIASSDPLQLDVMAPLEVVLQRFVLASLYFATDGDSWTGKYNFLSKTHECDWNNGENGVFCDSDEKVSEVTLVASNLNGTLPRDIGLLSTMEELNLAENSLRGDIPDSIGILADLITLDLSSNQLEGPLPRSFDMLKKLETVKLAENKLGGYDQPYVMAMLPSLKEVNISHNQILGELPSLAECSSLRIFDLSYNKISGSIHSDFGAGSSLRHFFINDNRIEGPIPPELGPLSNIIHFDASRNLLTGSIPTTIGQLSTLEILKLSENNLQFSLPSELGMLGTKLGILELDGNGFDTTFPSDMGKMKYLQVLSMKDNALTGALPSEIGYLSAMVRLDLTSNKFTDRLPSEIGRMENLQELYLKKNGFDGTLPKEFSNLFLLEALDISETYIIGDMDEALCGDRPEWGKKIALYRVDCLREEVSCSCATECCNDDGYCCEMTGNVACEVEPDQ